jgi:uncharacterized protein
VAGQRSTIFLLLGMAAWIAAGFAGAFVAAGVVGVVTGVLRGVLQSDMIPAPSPLGYVLIGATGFQGTLLLAALRQGRRAGNGNWRAGAGFLPIQRKPLIALLCALMFGWLLVFLTLMAAIPALREFAKSVTPQVLSGTGNDTAAVVIPRILLIAILAPVSEELFFRGWLWEASRRRGHTPAVTACLTAVPWLLLHGIDAPGRILVLIPAALIFSFARHVAGSVRGSLAVHMTNNTAAVLMQTLAALFGHEA